MEKQEIFINKIKIYSCIDYEELNTCVPISKIIFNHAAQTLQQNFCLDFS
jgi:hypothetical protein